MDTFTILLYLFCAFCIASSIYFGVKGFRLYVETRQLLKQLKTKKQNR